MNLVALLTRLGLVAALALAPALLLASPAQACSCVGLSPAEATAAADLVIVGELTDVEGGGGQTAYRVAVEGVEKGQSGAEATLLSASSGAACGLEFMEVGERYRFFATEREGAWWAGLCGGTTPVGDQPVDPEIARAPLPSPGDEDVARPYLPESSGDLSLLEGTLAVAGETALAGLLAWWLRRRRTT